MEEQVYRTIKAANDFIMAWINGAPPNTDDAYAELTALVHPELSNVHPSGARERDGSLLAGLRGAHGANPDLRIGTPREHTRLLFQDEQLVVAEVLELQTGARAVDQASNVRVISLLCLRDETAPHGLRIWRLHESLMPQEEAAQLDWTAVESGDN